MGRLLRHHFAPNVDRLRKAKGRQLTVEDLEEIGYFKNAGEDYPYRPTNYLNKPIDPACNCFMSLKNQYAHEWMNSLYRMDAALKNPSKHMKYACPVHVREVAAEYLEADSHPPQYPTEQ